MSLSTDLLFFQALKTSKLILSRTGKRVYNTDIECPPDDLKNVPVPYIIITFDGMRNTPLVMDEFMEEGNEDEVTIGIMTVAKDRERLAELVEEVRRVVREYFSSSTDVLESNGISQLILSLSAGPVNFDYTGPCYWQTLTYQCTINK